LSERDRLYLEEMLGAVGEIAALVDGQTEDVWIADRVRVAATSMYLIVLGEGAMCLSQSLKDTAPTVPWADMAGMRNRLAHGYFRADRRIIWETATSRVPDLEVTLLGLLEGLGGKG